MTNLSYSTKRKFAWHFLLFLIIDARPKFSLELQTVEPENFQFLSCQTLLLLLLLSHFSRVRLCATPQTAAHQAPRPWDSPGKNTGVGYHLLLQCTKVKSESEVKVKSLSHVRLSDPMDCSLPGSSIHGIFQARVLEWGAIPSLFYI